MDKRKDILRGLKVCRFCLSEDFPLSSMYDRSRAPKNTVTLPLQILSCVSIEIYPSDGMPKQICERCRFFMNLSYHFKQICRQADESIFQYVENGDALVPISWPTKLAKIFKSSGEGKGSKQSVKTLVTEGGACIQVQTDSEEDADNDEKAFNIKIEGDCSESASKKGSSFTIITGDEKVKIMNNDSTAKKEVAAGGGGGRADRWPCEDCHCAYPLRQLLELHRAQKHRRREVVCDLCGDKFFSKYDLSTHQLRHSDEMPFECVACDKKFNRLVLLKRHEKSKHADLPHYFCPECPVTFLSEEELVAHQKRHRQYAVRPYTCQLCNKKFYTNRAVQRHKETVHGGRRPYSCDLCPQRYSSGPKLARHVRTHVRGADYPCKYCNKVFMKSHHYTRHLRLKHKESDRSQHSSFGSTMQFRCDQCEEMFETQDDLIYHSAYHATQNLICPLCQEKFEDVDAVTAHIKSHVDSEQFMCDLCELVFTSKERLDIHLSNKHEEELRQEQEQSVDMGEDDSMEMEATEEEEEDQNISVKDAGDHMLVEIKKPSEFTITKITDTSQVQEKPTIEETNMEVTYTELATVDTLAIVKQQTPVAKAKVAKTPAKDVASPVKVITKASATAANSSTEASSILRKAEEIKRKGLERKEIQSESSNNGKSDKVETSSTAAGASDKTIRLLEKELRELQRTSSARSETGKSPALTVDSLRGRRPQIHTSTPKPKSIESRKLMLAGKHAEKKLPERGAVLTKDNKDNKDSKDNKDNKDSKENRESKNNNNNTGVKDDKEAKDPKAKAVVNNGAESSDETARRLSRDDSVRRSSRPSKIKDYAKMIRERTQESSSDDDDSDDGDDEYNQEQEVVEKLQTRGRPRKGVQKPLPKPAAASPRVESSAPVPPRKRGRPRKGDRRQLSPVQTKAKKTKSEVSEENEEPQQIDKSSQKTKAGNDSPPKEDDIENAEENSTPTTPKPTAAADVPKLSTSPGGTSSVLLSPSGQTLKKIPIKALPPGVKALPLPLNSRTMGGVCEMQIGQKVMKVQKIVMTKDKVEQLAKQGLIEMKDGTMVLKTGYKLASAGDSPTKTGAADAEVNKDVPVKKDKPAPTRCDFDPEEEP